MADSDRGKHWGLGIQQSMVMKPFDLSNITFSTEQISRESHFAQIDLRETYFGGIWEPNLKESPTITRYVIAQDPARQFQDYLIVFKGIHPNESYRGSKKLSTTNLVFQEDLITGGINFNASLMRVMQGTQYSFSASEVYTVADPPPADEFNGAYTFQYCGDEHDEFVSWFHGQLREHMHRLYLKGPKNYQEQKWMDRVIKEPRSPYELAHFSFINCIKHRHKTENKQGVVVWTYLEDLMMLMKLTWQGL